MSSSTERQPGDICIFIIQQLKRLMAPSISSAPRALRWGRDQNCSPLCLWQRWHCLGGRPLSSGGRLTVLWALTLVCISRPPVKSIESPVDKESVYAGRDSGSLGGGGWGGAGEAAGSAPFPSGWCKRQVIIAEGWRMNERMMARMSKLRGMLWFLFFSPLKPITIY